MNSRSAINLRALIINLPLGRSIEFLFQDRQREAAENGVDLNEMPDNASIHSDSSLRVDTFYRFPCYFSVSFEMVYT